MKTQRALPVLLATFAAVAFAHAAGAAESAAHVKAKEGTTTIHRERGADGLVDTTITKTRP